jgi:hypothetical protein
VGYGRSPWTNVLVVGWGMFPDGGVGSAVVDWCGWSRFALLALLASLSWHTHATEIYTFASPLLKTLFVPTMTSLKFFVKLFCSVKSTFFIQRPIFPRTEGRQNSHYHISSSHRYASPSCMLSSDCSKQVGGWSPAALFLSCFSRKPWKNLSRKRRRLEGGCTLH